MNISTAQKIYKEELSKANPYHLKNSFINENHSDHFLIKKLQHNIAQLDNRVQFFSFAIQEIKDITG